MPDEQNLKGAYDALVDYIHSREYDLSKIGKFTLSEAMRKQLKKSNLEQSYEELRTKGIMWEINTDETSSDPHWSHVWHDNLVAYCPDDTVFIALDVPEALRELGEMLEKGL